MLHFVTTFVPFFFFLFFSNKNKSSEITNRKNVALTSRLFASVGFHSALSFEYIFILGVVVIKTGLIVFDFCVMKLVEVTERTLATYVLLYLVSTKFSNVKIR